MRFENYPSGSGVITAHYEPGVDPDLLPCPFCGGTDAEVVNTHTASYWVECSCGVERHGPVHREGKSKAAHRAAFLAAIRAWNERPRPSGSSDEGGRP